MKEINIDNKIETNEKSKIELKDYDFEILSQENDNNFEVIDENIVESMKDTETQNNDIKDDNATVLKNNTNLFLKYFDYFISIILYINSFLYFSYLNLIHILYSFYLVFSKYSTSYGFFLRFKRKTTFILIFLEFIYLILKIIFMAYNSSYDKKILQEIFKGNWSSIYEYIFEIIVIILLFVYSILNDFTSQALKK